MSDKNAFCNECQRNTMHSIECHIINNDLEDVKDDWGKVFDSIGWYQWHELLRCKGCHTVFMLTSKTFSETGYDDPPATTRDPAEKRFKVPDWLDDLPNKTLIEIFKEVYTAIQYQCFALASSGIRSILDIVFVEKVGNLETFKQKVEAMIAKGHIASGQKSTIMSVIDAGSASAHRGFIPGEELVGKAVRITERLLEALYIHPDDASDIKSATPQRPKK